MGFYGNITNTARTQFQFDLVYPNRREMEKGTNTDGIYAGRYILIEYDAEAHLDTMLRAQVTEDGAAYYNPGGAVGWTNVITPGDVEANGLYIIYSSTVELTPATGLAMKDCKFYQYVEDPNFTVHGKPAAKYIEVVDGANAPAYTVNYNIDTRYYGAGRGYDSTVWQKVYTDNVEKYVMIAELNTVVPTFDVSPDAPTMNPIVPHFDTASTDVYYKLHWQAPWGFRVKTTDSNKSDEQAVQTMYEYDEKTNTHILKDNTVDAAIFYNKDAFDPQIGLDNIKKHASTVTINEIKVEPTGKSGNKYNAHDGTTNLTEQNDIQELTINLPAIGNMMSDAWDIIHGPNRDDARTDENSSLQGRLDSFGDINFNHIPVKRIDGVLVGSMVNGDTLYDNWEDKPTEILSDRTNPSFERDDAWIATTVNSTELVGGTEKGDSIDQSSNSGISIHHTFHATEDSVSTLDKNTGAVTQSDTYKEIYIPVSNDDTSMNDQIKLYTPYVDAKGHVVGKNVETITLPYGYRFFETDAVSDVADSDLYTTITNVDNGDNSSIVSANNSDLSADSTQDTLTLTPGNKWIQLKLDNESDTFTIAHEVHAVDEIAQSTNLNTDEVISSNDSDKITIQDIKFDTAGHVIQNRNHTYTLPYGFKTIKTNGRSTTEAENATSTPTTANIVADKTQDDLTINSGNKWIRIDSNASADSLTISHDIHNTSSTTSEQTLSSETAVTTFEVPTYSFDKAGHYISHDTKTITMPFGYGKISGDSGNTAATATFDEVTFTSDNWLTATVTKDTVTYTHDFTPKNGVNTNSNKNDESGNGPNQGAGDSLKLYTPVVDDKGHVVGANTETVILPYSYKTFKDNNGNSSVASNTQDTMTISGDNWISTVIGNDTLSITHKTPVSGTATQKQNVTPSYGETFELEDLYFDANGHRFETKSHTVAMPGLVLTPDTTGTVVTGIGLNISNSKATFIENKTNLGLVKLGSYDGSATEASIAGTDTLNSALNKIQNYTTTVNTTLTDKINGVNTNTNNRIDGLNVSDGSVGNQYVASVTQSSGLISATYKDMPTYTLSSGASNGTIKLNNNEVSVTGLKSAAYTNSSDYVAANATFSFNDEQKTIAELFALVAELQAKVTELEAYHNTTEETTE